MSDCMELFQLYHDDVYRLAISFVHSVPEAEDICQTVFLKLMEQEKIAPGKEKAWLMTVTANQCRSLLRSNWWKKREVLEETIPAEERQQDDFMGIIEQLKPNYRVVVYLYYYDEYSTQEIAEILRISRSVVTTRLARARQILKEEWKEELNDAGTD